MTRWSVRGAQAAEGVARRAERGSVTIWTLGLCIALLFVGGLATDLWRVFSERRALAGIVDAAAIAGGSGIDEALLRDTGQVQLDPPLAHTLAEASLGAQALPPSFTGAEVLATPAQIRVRATGSVGLTLTRVLLDAAPLRIGVEAVVGPAAGP